MDEREIIQFAIEKEAILFLGSGFSKGAKNFTQSGEFLVGKELCSKLIEDGEIDVTGEQESDLEDLSYIASRYLENDKNTKRDLLRLLKDIYCCKEVGREHEIVAALPWKKIYTTNYDDVMEVASRNVLYNRDSVEAKNKIGDVYSRKNAIIHVNGYINTVTENDLEDFFRLLDESYYSKSITHSDWATALHTDIKLAKAVVFIGYSLDYDFELQNIFACDDSLKDKCIFISLDPSRRQKQRMERFGLINEKGLKNFAQNIETVKQNYVVENHEYNFKCVKTNIASNQTISNVKAEDMIRLFVDGYINNELVFSASEFKYIFKRECVDDILKFIKEDGRVAIIHSDLANGKTVILKQLEVELSQTGTVYAIDDMADISLADDLEYISTLKGMHYIFIENYNQIIESETWRIIEKYQYSNIKYIFTARSYINDNFYNRVRKELHLNFETLGMYDVNELTDTDIKNFANLLAEYGLWAKKYASGINKQRKFIEKDCKKEIQNVLLEVYKSKSVRNEVNKILKELNRDELAKRVLLYTFICNIVSLPVEIDDMAIVLGVNRIDKIFFDEYDKLRELVLINGNKICIKSSSISSYILHEGKYNYNKELLEIINSIVNVFTKHDYSQRYANVVKYIISFSNLRLIFKHDDSDIKNIYIAFYENARATKFYKNNQFFWIQYAIAVMDLKDYAAAQIYLENASALSTKKYSEDSYQVNSLRARLILEKTMYEKDKKNAFKNFEQAHKIICSNKTPERHYPYRQVGHYIEFYKMFYRDFSQNEKVSFMYMCIKISEKIEEYLKMGNYYEKNVRRPNQYIKKIWYNLQDIIREMGNES